MQGFANSQLNPKVAVCESFYDQICFTGISYYFTNDSDTNAFARSEFMTINDFDHKWSGSKPVK